LSYLLADKLKEHPEHELARSSQSAREKALSLRGRAQAGDPLAIELFDFQARALGLHAAVLAITLDPSFVVIGGGLMDPESTTPQFRERYLGILRAAAMSFLWPTQRASLQFVPASLGELSQAVGAALIALYAARSAA
jgi:predicted NBD/HSP70 family sugar kinase